MTETTIYDETGFQELFPQQVEEEIRSACIVMPTYNEAENIERILTLLFEHMQHAPAEGRVLLNVLVVDDNSPDGTAKIVREYGRRNPYVHLLFRANKEGLGKAYIAGMRHAMDILDPDVIIEMDADLSHDPADVPRLIAAVRSGADFAIGSRYVDGGGIPEDWGAHRKLVSACANLATRSLLGISDIKDCSGGFRAIRAGMLKHIDLDSLDVRGYAFQAVLLESAIHHGARVCEIPIKFANRDVGESKMTWRDMVEGFTAFAKVRARRVRTALAEA